MQSKSFCIEETTCWKSIIEDEKFDDTVVFRLDLQLTRNQLSFSICIIYHNRLLVDNLTIYCRLPTRYWILERTSHGTFYRFILASSRLHLGNSQHRNSQRRSSKQSVTGDSSRASVSTYANEVMTIYRDNEVCRRLYCIVSHDHLYCGHPYMRALWFEFEILYDIR